MSKIIIVVPGSGGEKVYAYIGKFAPYDVGLTIGEIIQGLPDPQTARMCVTDIMAALAEYEAGVNYKAYAEQLERENLALTIRLADCAKDKPIRWVEFVEMQAERHERTVNALLDMISGN